MDIKCKYYSNLIINFFFIIVDVWINLYIPRLISQGLEVISRVNPLVPPGGLEPLTSGYLSQCFMPSELPLGGTIQILFEVSRIIHNTYIGYSYQFLAYDKNILIFLYK